MQGFEVLAKLGEGAFGQVYKVRRKKDSELYALKKIKMLNIREKERLNALNEIRILASHKSEYIIKYKESFFDLASKELCIVLQFAAEGDLQRKVQKHIKSQTPIDQSQIWKALVHLTKGLKLLHEHKVLHRDLKPANVFIMADGTYKLGDLNVSKVVRNRMARTQTGTPYYASPEVWKDRPYGPKSDMWSVGCILYEMAALRPPFMANDIPNLYKVICTGIFPSIPSHYSNELAEVISGLLKCNPTLRPSSFDLLNSPTVRAHAQCDTYVQNCSQYALLRTIKPERNWGAINKKLPKSSYVTEDSESLELQTPKVSGKKEGNGSYCYARAISARQRSVKDISIDNNRQTKNCKNSSSRNKESGKSNQQPTPQKLGPRLAGNRPKILSSGKVRNSSIRLSAKELQEIVEKCNLQSPRVPISALSKKKSEKSIQAERKRDSLKHMPPTCVKPECLKDLHPLKRPNLPPPPPPRNRSYIDIRQSPKPDSRSKDKQVCKENQQIFSAKVLRQFRHCVQASDNL